MSTQWVMGLKMKFFFARTAHLSNPHSICRNENSRYLNHGPRPPFTPDGPDHSRAPAHELGDYPAGGDLFEALPMAGGGHKRLCVVFPRLLLRLPATHTIRD